MKKYFVCVFVIATLISCSSEENKVEPDVPAAPPPEGVHTDTGSHRDTSSYERMSWPAPDSSGNRQQ